MCFHMHVHIYYNPSWVWDFQAFFFSGFLWEFLKKETKPETAGPVNPVFRLSCNQYEEMELLILVTGLHVFIFVYFYL